MPASQPVHWGGLELRIEPDFLLRRWFKLPLYPESTNPRFRVKIRRFADPQPASAPIGLKANLPSRLKEMDNPEYVIPLEAQFADGTSRSIALLTPSALAIGESAIIRTEHIMTAAPGQTRLVLPFFSEDGERWPIQETVFGYRVRSEEEIWGWGIGIMLAGIIGIASIFVQCR